MGARDNLQRLIDRKQQEVEGLEASLREARVYLQAIQDAMKSLPKEQSGVSTGDVSLRPGTIVYKTRELLRQSGKPLHITELLKLLGRPIDKNNRVAVAGTLAAYVRDGNIFTRPAPNTFGLVDMNGSQSNNESPEVEDDLPETFGR